MLAFQTVCYLYFFAFAFFGVHLTARSQLISQLSSTLSRRILSHDQDKSLPSWRTSSTRTPCRHWLYPCRRYCVSALDSGLLRCDATWCVFATKTSDGHPFYKSVFCLCSGTGRVVLVIKGVTPYKPCPMQVLFAVFWSVTFPFVGRKRSRLFGCTQLHSRRCRSNPSRYGR